MIKKIQENLKKVLQDIENHFDDANYIDPPTRPHPQFTEYVEEIDDSNPYEGASWGPAENWHCIRCGSHLKEVDEKEPCHGPACFSFMRRTGTLNYLCSNEKCCHFTAPLTLHHPFGGPDSPAGESYSISWVR